MVDRPFIASQRFPELQWRASRDGSSETIVEFARKLLVRMEKLGVPMYPTEFWRSGDRQNDLHALGRTKARAGESPHNHGMAVDIVHCVKGWGLDEKQWALVGHIGKEIAAMNGLKVDWGGDWKFWDPAHWEIRDWRSLV